MSLLEVVWTCYEDWVKEYYEEEVQHPGEEVACYARTYFSYYFLNLTTH